MQGIIKFYNPKGFGFIYDKETARDYFYHISNCDFFKDKKPFAGLEVEFDIAQLPKGIEAVNVMPARGSCFKNQKEG